MIKLQDADDDIKIAAKAIRQGELVAFPTETVYGLGADAFNEKALARVFEAKARPRFDPLIIHIADAHYIEEIADLSKLTGDKRRWLDALIAAFWPGPLTLILPKKPRDSASFVPDLATAGLPTAAIRFPSHPVARKLIEFSGCLIAAPSANSFGHLSPTLAEHVIEDIGSRIDYVIDGGPTMVGLESTVLDMTGETPCILRAGGVTREQIEKIINKELTQRRKDAKNLGALASLRELKSPGQLPSHYAPHTKLFTHEHDEMMALPKKSDEGYLYCSGNLIEDAAKLFRSLHELDSAGYTCIHAELPPEAGIGAAIRDRLIRAGAR
ncbi:MAG: threonylcarbamoyl-AMP synthase [Spirochaetaceae bacterium]|jgi:L-threonylcarbamoyladenylate synthase|nr:threonylcarbamoyl-AMP synthase [Spirochaetaceae bacterium]